MPCERYALVSLLSEFSHELHRLCDTGASLLHTWCLIAVLFKNLLPLCLIFDQSICVIFLLLVDLLAYPLLYLFRIFEYPHILSSSRTCLLPPVILYLCIY